MTVFFPLQQNIYFVLILGVHHCNRRQRCTAKDQTVAQKWHVQVLFCQGFQGDIFHKVTKTWKSTLSYSRGECLSFFLYLISLFYALNNHLSVNQIFIH